MKYKNLTFEKDFSSFCDPFGGIVIDISGDDYIFTQPGDGHTYLTGPAVDRLHEFEKLNMEPKEIETLINNYRHKTNRLNKYDNLGYTPEHLKELIRKRKDPEPLDIHKLIDEVREKKDCRVHILIGDGYTSVDIRPDEPGIQNWIITTDEHAKRICICPNCGYIDENPGLYCRFCGEQLGLPRLEKPKSNDTPKKMTCREKLKQEHPDKINDFYVAGCSGCPHKYGYANKPDNCSLITCNECWDREIES